ncbi:hypothetical protein SETIT_1G338300v2 [Setaria italica]|uniref:Uncharacterized protein n=1 Tax=Setaria italica TaxID=4555 RepID=A0A368PSI3_SETIT|nr:hypothetical protein SETIT_1G338300v2 [Setaria italica]
MLRTAAAGGCQRGGLRYAVVRSADAAACGGHVLRWLAGAASSLVMQASIASGERLYRCRRLRWFIVWLWEMTTPRRWIWFIDGVVMASGCNICVGQVACSGTWWLVLVCSG